MEKEALKRYSGEVAEAFQILGGYPEQDRANRHTVAAAIVASMSKPVGQPVPKEMTILSKAFSALPTTEEWEEMFRNPGPASWPDPFTFRPAEYGIEVAQK